MSRIAKKNHKGKDCPLGGTQKGKRDGTCLQRVGVTVRETLPGLLGKAKKTRSQKGK